MDSGMSSAETLPRLSSDEELSQESISFSEEKVINEVYIKDNKENDASIDKNATAHITN